MTLKNRKPLRRKAPFRSRPAQGRETRSTLKRKAGVRKSNRARRAKELLRAYGGESRIAWMKARPCVVPGCRFWRVSGVEIAHIVTGGMSRKSDARFTVPACPHHHAAMHGGIQSFAKTYHVDLNRAAAYYETCWQADR